MAQWNTRNGNVSAAAFDAEHHDSQQQQRRLSVETTDDGNPYNQDISRATAPGSTGRLGHVGGGAGTEEDGEMEEPSSLESKWALAAQLEAMLFHMLDMYEKTGVEAARPKVETFRLVAKAYRNAFVAGWPSSSTRCPHDAFQAYLEAQQHHEGILQSLLPPPTPECVTPVQKTEGLLKLAECLHEKDPSQWHDLRPTTAMFNILLRSYAFACSCLKREYHPQDPSRFVPSETNATAAAAVSDLPQRALAVYEYMANHSEAELRPNASTISFCLEVLADHSLIARTTNEDSDSDKLKLLGRADQLLQELKQEVQGSQEEAKEEDLLLLQSMGSLLVAWSKVETKQGVLRAHEVLMEMVHLSRLRDAREAKFSQANTFSKTDDEEENVSLPPPLRPLQISTQLFTTVIAAYGRWGGVGSGQGANDVLEQMMALYQEGRLTTPPSLHPFSACIKAWSFERPRNDPERAEAVLEQPHALHEGGSPLLRPDLLFCNAVLSACARSDSFSRTLRPEGGRMAVTLFERADALYEKEGEETMRPDVVLASTVVKALATGWEAGNVQRAVQVLERMEGLYAETQSESTKPTAYLMNNVMNCAANTKGNAAARNEAFKVALSCFQKLRTSSDLRPDSFSYGFFLKACHNLLEPSEMRDDTVRKAFEECCEQGCVNGAVLSWVERCLSGEKISWNHGDTSPGKRRQQILPPYSPKGANH